MPANTASNKASSGKAEPEKRSRGLIPLISVIVGTALMGWAFVNGISAALNGAGSNPPLFVILFIAGGILVLGSLVTASLRLLRHGFAVLPLATVVIAFVPIIAVLGLRFFAV